LYLHGQEVNLSTFAIAKINMFLHGLDEADIRRGDTLSEPQFLDSDGTLKTFDIVVANFPYSKKEWSHETFKNDRYGRLEGYEAPPKKNADYAFILHILGSLNQNGRAGIVVPHGVLFRGGAEGRIRENLIRNDVVEAVVSLPEKLFYGTGIPAAILILNRNKPEEHKNKVQIINAEHEYEEGKKQNRLRNKDISHIVDTYDAYADEESYARVVDFEELEENDFNLNVRRYIADDNEEEDIDVSTVWNELQELEKRRDEADKKVQKYMKELNY
jgi:type I restriction enzyme M protein